MKVLFIKCSGGSFNYKRKKEEDVDHIYFIY